MSNLEKRILPLFDIPFVEGGRKLSGCDCWGLVLLFYKEVLGKDLPTYEGIFLDIDKGREGREATSKEIMRKKQEGLFDPVSEPEFGDILLVDFRGRPVHIAVVVGENRMIHTSEATGVVIENYLEDKWKSRLKGFYRPKVV